MDHEPLPSDVQRKLEQAHRWLRERDAHLADCLASWEIRACRRVILATPERPAEREAGDRRILVNPSAIRDLSPEIVAGALVSSLLAAAPSHCEGERRSELWRRAERVRRGLELT